MKTPIPIDVAVERATGRVRRRPDRSDWAWRAFVLVVAAAFVGMCAWYLLEEWT